MQATIQIKDLLHRYRSGAMFRKVFHSRTQYLCTFIRDEILLLPNTTKMDHCESAIRDLFAEYFVGVPNYLNKCTLANWFTTEMDDGYYEIQPVGGEVMTIHNPYNDPVQFRIALLKHVLEFNPEASISFEVNA